MFWLSLLIIVVLVAIGIVVRPLLRHRSEWVAATVPGGEQNVFKLLEAEKARVLRQLKDLEMERDNGGLDDAEFEDLRRSYLVEAALLNRRIAMLEGKAAEVEAPREKAASVKGGHS